MKSSDPTVNQAYNIIVENEDQRPLHMSVLNENSGPVAMQTVKIETLAPQESRGRQDPHALQANRGRSGPFGRGNFGKGQSGRGQDFRRGQFGRGVGLRGKRTMFNTGTAGVEVTNNENCWEIIRYPPDYKTKAMYGQGGQRYANTNNAVRVNDTSGNDLQSGSYQPYGHQSFGESSSSTEPKVGHFFTDHQYQQILNMLHKDSEDHMVNMAGSLRWQGEGDW